MKTSTAEREFHKAQDRQRILARREADHLSPEDREAVHRHCLTIQAAVNALAGFRLISLAEPPYNRKGLEVKLLLSAEPQVQQIDVSLHLPSAVAEQLRSHAALCLRAAEMLDGAYPRLTL